MKKVTVIKKYHNKETLRAMELSEVVHMISSGAYAREVASMRQVWQTIEWSRRENGEQPYGGLPNFAMESPKVCFATEMVNNNGQRVRKGYTGLMLLEVNNLRSTEEAVAVRQGAGMMPHTMLAFVGVDGRSVKIVCGGEMLGGGLPETDEAIKRFHLNLYEKARLAYNAQLGVTIDKKEPLLERSCYVSHDQQTVYNPHSILFYTDDAPLEKALKPLQPIDSSQEGVVPGHNRYQSMRLIYEYNLTKAWDDTTTIENEEERHLMVLTRLAEYCQKTGLEMGFAQHQTIYSPTIGKEKMLVYKVFENAYREENEKGYRKRMGLTKPLATMPRDTLMTMKVGIFLHSNYEMRKNVMRGVVEYRQRMGLGFSYQDLTEEARNSITNRALSHGISCWDKDIRRYVNSDDVTLYDPMYDFLEHLPQWDGKRDYVAEMAGRIQTDYEEWPHLFHIWMRSMVAMWMGKGQLTGNALVPLLIGRQGCGKSSFCRILLPSEMRDYYNDRINFKNENDLNLGLTSFGLINLDEFDRVTKSQQIVLKYLVSTADVKFRPPYGKAYASHRRYASFIGTTNEPTPLVDPTGSRRFICVPIKGSIDFESKVNYPQLYAQLKSEVESGARYYMTKEEERTLMEHNLHYQKINGLGEMILAVIDRADTEAEDGKWFTLPEISALLKQHFGKAYRADEGTLVKIGQFLSRPEYPFKKNHTVNGQAYWARTCLHQS